MVALLSFRQKMLVFLVVFFVFLSNLYGFDINITGKELGFDVKPEFNRVFYYCYDFSFFGSLEFNEKLNLGGGIALGQIGKAFDIDLFGRAELKLPLPISLPLSVNLLGMYNGIPDYLTHVHTVLPFLSLKGKWAGASVGMTLRSTLFDNEPVIFESILAFSAFVNFLQTDRIRIGLECANFDNFLAGNMGSYFLNLNSLIHLTKGISLINEIRIEQTGSVGLNSNFYGIAYRGGVVCRW
jgi:hypothetical protein